MAMPWEGSDTFFMEWSTALFVCVERLGVTLNILLRDFVKSCIAWFFTKRQKQFIMSNQMSNIEILRSAWFILPANANAIQTVALQLRFRCKYFALCLFRIMYCEDVASKFESHSQSWTRLACNSLQILYSTKQALFVHHWLSHC